MKALAERLDGRNVAVNASTPGMARTELTRGFPSAIAVVMDALYFKLTAWSAEVCARTLTESAIQGAKDHGSIIAGTGNMHP
jgi:NAD(P)-dependent dehydrogenase (short-subunit alcohol dehydrogenase family)